MTADTRITWPRKALISHLKTIQNILMTGERPLLILGFLFTMFYKENV